MLFRSDIQLFSTMNSLLKDRVANNRTSLFQIDYLIKGAAEKIELYKKHIESLKTNNDQIIAQKQQQIDNLNQQVDQSNQRIESIGTQIDFLNSSIIDYSKVIDRSSKLSSLMRQLDNKIDKISKELQFFEESDDCPTCKIGRAHV